jgi:hypothetical protein
MNLNNFALEGVNPLRGLDLPVLISRIESGERGYYSMLQWTYRWVEKTNPTVRAVKKRLMSALGALKWDIKIVDVGNDETKKAAAEKQQKELRADYDAISNLRDALNFLALTELRGFSHLEKVYAGAINKRTDKPYDSSRDKWDVIELRIVEQWYWARKGLYGPWLYNKDARETNSGDPIDLAHYVIHAIDDPADEIFARLSTQQGVNDADWDGFLEDYGVPPQFFVLPPNVPKDKEAEYQRMAELAISRARGSVPNGTTLLSPTISGSGAGVFKERLAYLDELMVRAGTAGKLTILAESGSGNLAGGAQKDAFDEIAQAIADQLSGVMQKQFDLPLLKRKFPNEPVLAYFEFAPVDEEETGKVLGDAKIAKEAGYRMNDDELSEKTGYKLTFVGDATAGANGNELTKRTESATAAASATSPAPDSQPAPSDQAAGAVANNLHLTAAFVAPARSVIDNLLAQAQSGEVSNEQLAAAAEEFLKRIPEIAETTDVTEVATALENAMRSAAEATLAGKA